ncbi:MAG: cation-transporting P-type ATPase [Clostridia bacterium]|nr:cation-transporting P-type ATPase [Clostridia bacterium]
MNDRNNWHLISSADAARTLDSDKFKGLSEKSAQRRRRRFGENSVWYVRRAGAGSVARATVFDLATLLLVITTAAAAMFEMNGVAIAMLVILVIAGAMRMTAFIRAARILESMAEEKIPVCSVIRDGRAQLLSAREIVPGDVVFVEAGDVIPCDGRVISVGDSVVIENGITENKAPVHKFDTIIKTESDSAEVPAEYRSNMVFAGSAVKSGKIRILATATGEDTLIVRRQGGIELTASDEFPTVEALSKQSRAMSLIMIAFVMLITVISLFVGDEFTLPEVFLGTMAMAVAAMSEFLTAIAYIIISVTVLDASRGGDGAKIPKLKLLRGASHPRIDMRNPGKLDGVASPTRMVFMGSSFFKSGRAELFAYRVDGRLTRKEGSPERLLSFASAAASTSGFGLAGEGDSTSSTTMSRLISRAVGAYTAKTKRKIQTYSPIAHVPSSDESAAGLDISIIERDGELHAVACGPIDAVLRVCKTELTADGERALDASASRAIYTECAKLEFGGARVVAVCEKVSEYSTLSRIAAITCEMKFVGFFAVAEESERGAKDNVKYLRERGIVPILFTRTPKEDLYYCHRIGLFNKNTKIIPISSLTGGYDEDATDGVIVSFEGVAEEKLPAAYASAMDKLSEGGVTAALAKRKPHARAFSKADVGFAVSRGSIRPIPELISKFASVAVYPSKSESQNEFGGFSGVIYAMRLACRAKRNTSSARFYLTASQIARLIVILASVLFALPMPSPVFILIWGLIFDFLAVVSMAFSDEDSVTDDMPKNVLASIAVGALLGALSVAWIPLANVLASRLATAVTAEALTSVMAGAIILSSLVLFYHSIKRGSLFASREINLAHLVFVISAVVLAMLVMFTGFGASIAGAVPCPTYAAFAILPAMVILAVLEATKLVFVKREQKKEAADEE